MGSEKGGGGRREGGVKGGGRAKEGGGRGGLRTSCLEEQHVDHDKLERHPIPDRPENFLGTDITVTPTHKENFS